MDRAILGLPLALALAACGSRAAQLGPPDGAPDAATSAAPEAGAAHPDAGPPPAAVEEAPAYDLVLAHGRLIDPASGRDGAFDVAVTAGRIARIAPSIDASRAARVVDVSGLVVAPGLVDLHVHVFRGRAKDRYLAGSPLAAVVDEAAPRSCTTTVVDAGSAGHRSFAAFEAQIIATARTRVLAFLDIVGEGMRGGRFEQDLGDMDARATAAAVEAHADRVVGVKVAHYAGPGWEPIDRAVQAARESGTRVMVDFGGHAPELSLEELLLRRMRPGDIFTHLYASVRGRTAVVDAGGKLRPYLRPARERGVLFDIGHGGASFVWSQAAPAIAEGFLPDTVSTDMHRSSLRGSMRDLPNVMSKLAALGMTLPDLIRKTTVAPADAIARPALGRLAEGGEADIAVLGVERGRFTLTDTSGAHMDGAEQITCELTVRAGAVLFDRKGRGDRRLAPR